MKKSIYLPIPARKALRKLGSDISAARRRRRISVVIMSERTSLSRATISRIEKGDSATSVGGYSAVLFVLGMLDRLSDIADAMHDLTGRALEDERLPKRIRYPKTKRENE